MIDERIKDANIIGCIEMIVAIVIVLNNASVWISEYQSVFFNRVVLLLFYSSIILLCLLSPRLRRLSNFKIIIFNMALLVYFVIYIIMQHSNLLATLELFIAIFLLEIYIVLEGSDGIKRILEKYKTIMLILAVISLFFWMFGSLLNWIEPTGQIYSNWTGTENGLAVFKGYFNLHFETQYNNDFFGDGDGIIRNTSIFSEAPMYSLHLSMALLVEMFIVNRISKINIGVFIITIITTMSSTGYALIALALFFKFIIWSYDIEGMKYLRFLAVVILLLSITSILIQLFNNKADTLSGIIRIDDYIVALETWESSPVFGVGIGNFDSLKQHMGLWRSFNVGFSNSIGLLLAQGGLWLFSFYMYIFYKGIIQSYKMKKYNTSCSSVLVLYLFCFAITTYNFNLLFFLSYMMANVMDGNNNTDLAKIL